MIDFIRIMIAGQKAKTEERGASAVEYGLLVAGIAALIVAVVFFFGDFIEQIFSDTCATIAADGTATTGGDAGASCNTDG